MFNSTFDTIFCPPVNSSGDAYHIAAYLILCRTMREDVPQVILFCDTDKTEQQALRSKSFLKAMSFGNIRVQRFDLTSAHPPARLAKSTALVQRFSECAVDQKVTTSLISFAQLSHGKFINDAVAKHISNFSFNPKAIAADKWATTQVNLSIKKLKINKQMFVILNLRYSNTANKEQNLSLQQLKTISKTLAQRGCKLIIIDVGSDQGNSFVKKHNGGEYASAIAINAFPTVKDLHKNYEKFPHLFLLLQLSGLSTCMGVIGNTSGTLDAAAFMGIRALCVHRFKSASNKNIIVPHQDLRVLLQANMMSVFDYEAGLHALANMISRWLTTTRQHILCHSLSQSEKITLEDNIFRVQHYDRSCFTLDTNYKVANPVFNPQYLQLNCDQKLSDSMNKRISATDYVATIAFAFSARQRSKDEMDLKPLRRITRSSSTPAKASIV